MLPVSASDVLATVDAASVHLPDLQVLIAPSCHGKAWIVDPRHDTIWIDGSLPAAGAASAVVEAVGVLRTHHGIPDRRLRLIVDEPAQFRVGASTGTDG